MTKEDALRKDFEWWLKTTCFQPPTKEAEDLAWSAWLEITGRNTTKCEIGYPECQRNWNKNAKCFYRSCDD